MHLRMSIDRLTESALIMDIGRLSPSAIILAQDLRKSSTIFYILAISCTIGTGLAAKVALVNWILIITKSKRRLHNLFTLVCISVVYLGLVGSVYYGATLKIDSAGFLPLVSEVVRLFCLTHQADQCKTRFVPLAGSIAFNGILIYLATIVSDEHTLLNTTNIDRSNHLEGTASFRIATLSGTGPGKRLPMPQLAQSDQRFKK